MQSVTQWQFSSSSAAAAVLNNLTQVTFKNKLQSYFFPLAVLPEAVESLWRLAATVTPLSSSDLQVGERGPESTDSEKEREREMIEVAEQEEARLEISPKEVPWIVSSLWCFFLRWGRKCHNVNTCVCVYTGGERSGRSRDAWDVR